MPIKTFRGQMAMGAQDTIHLHTNDGKIGYIIKDFKIISETPGVGNVEFVVKIYSVNQTAIDAAVDFSDQTLLGCYYFQDNESASYTSSDVILFDNIVTNQDMYVTARASLDTADVIVTNQDMYVTAQDAGGGSKAVNYMIKLEQIKLSLDENTVATLKDIRNITG